MDLGTLGKVLLGLGFIFTGVSSLGSTSLAGTGDRNKKRKARAGRPGKLGAPQTRPYNVSALRERVSHIQRLICKGGLDPVVHEKAKTILSRKCGSDWCTKEKDWTAEQKALFNLVRANVRYVKDPLNADAFSAAGRVLATGAGDCDDLSIVLGSLLQAVGHEVRLVVVQTKDKPSWSHIFIQAKSDSTGKWLTLDASVSKPAGWEPPGTSAVLRTGKPSGMIQRAQIFEVRCT